jgi:hypothetical protein
LESLFLIMTGGATLIRKNEQWTKRNYCEFNQDGFCLMITFWNMEGYPASNQSDDTPNDNPNA